MTTRNILCFGDSLTWGWVPKDPPFPSERFSPDLRWTGVLANLLGDGYRVIEEGLNARTTSADDPTDPRVNGADYLSPWQVISRWTSSSSCSARTTRRPTSRGRPNGSS